MSLLYDVVDRIISLFYPKHCPCCDEITLNNEDICPDCLEKLIKFRLVAGTCKKCGLPQSDCTCKKRVFLFDGITAPFRYQDEAAIGVLNIKKKKSIENAKFFATYMSESAISNFPSVKFNIVTNVPMFKEDEKARDFNHSKILAKLVSKNIKVRYKDTLKQIEKRKNQHELTYLERIKNVKDVYKTKADVTGMNILLVDDIKTSGSSLNECAHELLLAGAESVWCLCAAITCKKTL